VPHFAPGTPKWLGTGVQLIAKFRETARNSVLVAVAVVRLAKFNTDLIVSVNAPIELDPRSSSGVAAASLRPESDASAVALETLGRVMETLELLDEGLFVRSVED
jgi:hypothetical protein